MKFHDLNSLVDVYLEGLVEPSDNSLRLYFSRSIKSTTPESITIGDKEFDNLFSIDIDEVLPIIQIDFE
ncbi:hypothetical protein D1872_311310 [compost metagenome]